MTETELAFALIEREQLGAALRGEATARKGAWSVRRPLSRLHDGQVLLVWAGESLQPNLVVVADHDREDLLSWLITFHSDLSPLSSWCQVMTPAEFDRSSIESPIIPRLFGMEAAWIGAIFAEAMILSGRSYEELSLNALLATESFATARAAAVYGARAAATLIPERFENIRRQFQRSPEKREGGSRVVGEVLLGLLPDSAREMQGNKRILVDACRDLLSSGEEDTDILKNSGYSFKSVSPELGPITGLSSMSAEERVRYLRYIQDRISYSSASDRVLYTFAAGYVISRVGGGERDFRLADSFGKDRGEILSWAAVTGGLGANTFWTDAFAGLGRFVGRELIRPVHLLDPPLCDASYDEVGLFDERLTRLKIRSANRSAVAVSLLPGVVVHFSAGEVERPASRPTDSARSANSGIDFSLVTIDQLDILAERLLPLIRSRLQPAAKSAAKDRRGPKAPRLPFKPD
ncbi:hypothetical protein [Mesorhizobium sp. RIZ17]|uniref:hypothetical protein n=1 Tax=Mesorhizobium sp. RIZ17 TaxID=3132743 RepID=UPI003DAA44B2